jgi:hypothetical protein
MFSGTGPTTADLAWHQAQTNKTEVVNTAKELALLKKRVEILEKVIQTLLKK